MLCCVNPGFLQTTSTVEPVVVLRVLTGSRYRLALKWWEESLSAACGYAFIGFGFGSGGDGVTALEFEVNSFVGIEAFVEGEESGDARELSAGDLLELRGWEWASVFPVGEDGEHVGAVLGFGQVKGIGEIVADVEGHPEIILHPSLQKRIEPSCWVCWVTIQPLERA